MLTRFLFLLLICAILVACGGADEAPQYAAVDPSGDWIETGDLDAIARHGALRILVHQTEDGYLAREGEPADIERRMAEAFARQQGLEPIIVALDDYAELIPALLEGRGDLIAANMTATDARREQVAFSVALDQTSEIVVGRPGGPEVSKADELSSYRVGVMLGTSFWEVAEEQLADIGGIKLLGLPSTLTSDEVLDRLAADEYDFTLQDSNVLDVAENYRDDFQRQFELGSPRPLAKAVRPDNIQLLETLNRFLTRERLTRSEIAPHTDDLDGIRERRVLRVITRNNAATYYLHRGEMVGFEYELAKRFADVLGVRLQMVVAPDHSVMIDMLREGRGDIIAAFMTHSDEREALGVRFSRPYHYATETVVGRADESPLEELSDLDGRSLHVRPGSSYWATAERLLADGAGFDLQAVPTTMETEDIIARVASGEFDLTLADSHILQAEQLARGDIHGLLEIGEPVAHGWVLRDSNPDLLRTINTFWDSEYRGLHYNIFYRRYFQDDSRIQAHRAERIRPLEGGGKLSPWDELTREYAEKYGFDWRLILAQMYQESRFDPEAVSWVGARGLMQVMPRTGRELGLKPLDDPETGIHAGTRYMDWLRDRFPEHLPVDERTWFSLAAYNAGIGHVRDARRLARQKGWDPDRWFGHVDQAMLLLSQPEYHRNARHGYVRGHEPYQYVRHIRDRYRAYVMLTEPVLIGQSPSAQQSQLPTLATREGDG